MSLSNKLSSINTISSLSIDSDTAIELELDITDTKINIGLYHLYGINSNTTLLLVDENKYIYSVSNHIIIYNVKEKIQEYYNYIQFIYNISKIAINYIKNLLVVAEDASAKTSSKIYIINLIAPYNIERTFIIPWKILAVSSVVPNNQLIIYKIETDVILAHKDLPHAIKTISFSPNDDTILCVSGIGYIRLIKRNGMKLDEYPLLKVDIEETFVFTDHMFLNEQVIAVSEDYQLFIFKDGKLISKFDISKKSPKLIAFRNSFIVYSDKVIAIYDNKNQLHQKIVLEFDVASICRYENKDTLLLLGSDGRVVNLPLELTSTSDSLYTTEVIPIVDTNSHSNQITGLSLCHQRSFSLTCSDSNMYIWDCNKFTLLNVTTLPENPVSFAIHPNGYQVICTFGSSIILYSITIKGLVKSYELFLNATRLINFSSSGSIFSFCKGANVYYYDFYSFKQLGEYTLHRTPIKIIAWSHDDRLICSLSTDGLLVGYGVPEQTCIFDFVAFNVSQETLLIDWSLTSKRHEVTLMGSDNILRRIKYNKIVDENWNGELKREKIFGSCKMEVGNCELILEKDMEVGISHLAFALKNKSVIAANKTGSLLVFKHPIIATSTPVITLSVHSGPISNLLVHPHSHFVHTLGADGTYMVSYMNHKDFPVIKQKAFYGDSDLGLYLLDDVRNLENSLAVLETQSRSYSADTKESFQFMQLMHEKKVDELENTIRVMTGKEEAMKVLQQEQLDHQKEDHLGDIEALKELQEEEKRNILSKHHENLMIMRKEFDVVRNQYEAQFLKLAEENKLAVIKHNESLDLIKKGFEQKEKEFEIKMKEIQTRADLQREGYETAIDNIEESYESEIMHLNDESIKKSHSEAVTTGKAISTMSMAVRQYEASHDSITNFKIEISNLNRDNDESKQKIEFLQTEVMRAKQYIIQRDAEIALRQKDLSVITEKLAEKDRIREIVNLRLQQFEEQEEPRSIYIAQILEQLQNVTERAEVLEEVEKRYEEKENISQQRIKFLEKQLNEYNQKINIKQQSFEILLNEIAFIAESVPSNEYGIEIGKLYSKYVNSKVLQPSESSKMLVPIENHESDELVRQRNFLTKKTDMLTHQIKVIEKRAQVEKLAAIASHTQMSDEINVLQYENRKLQSQIADLNSRLLSVKSEIRNKERERVASDKGERERMETPKTPKNHYVKTAVEAELENCPFVFSAVLSPEKQKSKPKLSLTKSSSRKSFERPQTVPKEYKIEDLQFPAASIELNGIKGLELNNIGKKSEIPILPNNTDLASPVTTKDDLLMTSSREKFSKDFPEIINNQPDDNKNSNSNLSVDIGNSIHPKLETLLSEPIKSPVENPKGSFIFEKSEKDGLINLDLHISTNSRSASPINVPYVNTPTSYSTIPSDFQTTFEIPERDETDNRPTANVPRPLTFSNKFAGLLSESMNSNFNNKSKSKLSELGPSNLDLMYSQDKKLVKEESNPNLPPFMILRSASTTILLSNEKVIRPSTAFSVLHPLNHNPSINLGTKPRLSNSSSASDLSKPFSELQKLNYHPPARPNTSLGSTSPKRPRSGLMPNFESENADKGQTILNRIYPITSPESLFRRPVTAASFPTSISKVTNPNQPPIPLTTINHHPTYSKFPAMPSTFIKTKKDKA